MTGSAKPAAGSKRGPWIRKLRLLYLRQFPRRKHMHGGLLHRLLGERLFDKRLWKPERKTFAAGMAIGLFVGLLPTYWVQILLAVMIVYVFRVNITAAVLGTLITNPFTTLPIVGLQVKVGAWLIGATDPGVSERYHGIMKLVFSHGKQYLVGSLVTAVLAAILGYFAVLIFWQAGAKVKEVREKRKEAHPG
ncbi:MAG TPA: DUF2062 domain-containing protein [Fibrobacteria bacterium]|nr:DUF2062 domain-containing protein [Fibrobacteria bacterium]